MKKCVLDKLADIYNSLDALEWDYRLGEKPENFDLLNKSEKYALMNELKILLVKMIDNTSQTLISWSHYKNKFNAPFSIWLKNELAYIKANKRG